MIKPGIISSHNLNSKRFVNPKSINGLLGWWDCTDLSSITSASNLVSQINDKSGNGFHLTQATGGSQPTLVSSGGQNNFPYVSFGASKTMANVSITQAQPFTVFFVVRQNNFVINALLLQLNTITGLPHRQATPGGVTKNYLGIVAGSNYDVPYTYPTTYRNAEFILVSATFGGTAAVNNYYVGINDCSPCDCANLGTPGTTGINQITVNTGASLSFDVHELFIYNKEISAGEYKLITQAYQSKYVFSNYTCIDYWGDSITKGSGVTYDVSYPYLTSTELTFPFHSNYGLGGSTLQSNFIVNWGESLRNNTKGWAIINFGANYGDYVSLGASAWGALYKQYVQYFIDAGYDKNKIVLCSCTPGGPSSPSPNAAGIKTQVEAVVAALGTRYCDFYTYILARQAASYDADQLHPNTTGHRNMADCLKLAMA